MYPLKVNTQPITKRGEVGTTYKVIDVWPTIQGEGPFVGERSIFVRFAGCNLTCPACDTEYTEGAQEFTVQFLANRIREEAGGSLKNWLVVFTGGEPLLNNIGSIVKELTPKGSFISSQIETNGTQPYRYSDGMDTCTIVCSPKIGKVDKSIEANAEYWKYIIEAGQVDTDGLPTSVLGNKVRPYRPRTVFVDNIYVQPMMTGDPVVDKANLDECLNSVMKFGYKLSLQTHKLIGVK